MHKLITMIVVFTAVLIYSPTLLSADTIPTNWCNQRDYTCLTKRYSDLYGVKNETMLHIIKCESGFNSEAHNASGEDSWGLVQINLRSHKDITREQATNPDFALNFLASNLKAGKSRMWTCAK